MPQNENPHQESSEPSNYYADEELDYYQPRPEDKTEGFFAGAVGHSLPTRASKVIASTILYRRCCAIFPSKNKLHRHLGNPGKGRHARKSTCLDHPPTTSPAEAYPSVEEVPDSISRNKTELSDSRNGVPATTALSPDEVLASRNELPTSRKEVPTTPALAPAKNEKVVESSTDSSPKVDTEHAFRNYHYAMAAIKLLLDKEAESGCLDTGCSVTLMDRTWFRKAHPTLTIKHMASPITVRGLGSNRHQTSEYVITPLYFPGKDSTARTAPREIHIVDDLKANILIDMDIMIPKKIDIFVSEAKASIDSCNITVPVEVRTRGRAITHPVHIKKSIVIPPRSQVQIPVHHASLPKREFFFEPDQLNLTLYAHLVDSSLSNILAKNDSDQTIKVSRNLRLETVQEADFDNCYHVTEGQKDVVELASRHPAKKHKGSWIKRVFNKFVTTSAVTMLATAAVAVSAVPATFPVTTGMVPTPALSTFSPPTPKVAVATSATDTILSNGVTIHENNSSSIQGLVEEFPTLWQEGGFAKLPEQEWMRIPLKSDWEKDVPKTPRVYPLSTESKDVVDKTFDKLHDQGRLD